MSIVEALAQKMCEWIFNRYAVPFILADHSLWIRLELKKKQIKNLTATWRQKLKGIHYVGASKTKIKHGSILAY